MKILTAEQMRRVDRLTTERLGIPSATLMENAGRHVAEFILHRCKPQGRVTVLCGKGNNGGDGLVAARRLLEKEITLQVALLAEPDGLKGDAAVNFEAFKAAGGEVSVLPTVTDWEKRRDELLDCDLLVDAMLGTGLSGPARDPVARAIASINAAAGRFRVLAVDVPSGLASDSGESPGEAIRAHATITFTAPKFGLIFPPNTFSVGELYVAPIGSPDALCAEAADWLPELVTECLFASLPLKRPVEAHKGDFGHVLLVAGSRGMTGAAGLAGKAALRTGAGLVTVATPESMLPVVAGYAPEYTTAALAETESGSVSTQAFSYGRFDSLQEGKSVLALGPGLSTHPETVEFVRRVVRETPLPLILDADGLNALVGALEILRERRTETVVLTPHPGEMARLVGATSAEVQKQRMEVARNFAGEFSVYVILKGYRTLIATPSGGILVNPTGGPGLARGGTGDVLTGVLAGALAQFPGEPLEKVLGLGVYLHGLAGDIEASRNAEQSVLASDIADTIGSAWMAVRENIEKDDPERPYRIPSGNDRVGPDPGRGD